jgi:hypothetical protein
LEYSLQRSNPESGRALACFAPRPAGNAIQLALDGAGTAELPAVQLGEIVHLSEEHEAAGDADGDPDGAAVELDRKTLC